jgi:hypothetical protein
MRRTLDRINRGVAASLALIWACAGLVGLIAAYLYGRWVLAIAAIVALAYAALWAQVVKRGRLLTWREIGAPWKAR